MMVVMIEGLIWWWWWSWLKGCFDDDGSHDWRFALMVLMIEDLQSMILWSLFDDGAMLSLSSCSSKLQQCRLRTFAAVSGLTDSNMKTKIHYYRPVYHIEYDKVMLPPSRAPVPRFRLIMTLLSGALCPGAIGYLQSVRQWPDNHLNHRLSALL